MNSSPLLEVALLVAPGLKSSGRTVAPQWEQKRQPGSTDRPQAGHSCVVWADGAVVVSVAFVKVVPSRVDPGVATLPLLRPMSTASGMRGAVQAGRSPVQHHPIASRTSGKWRCCDAYMVSVAVRICMTTSYEGPPLMRERLWLKTRVADARRQRRGRRQPPPRVRVHYIESEKSDRGRSSPEWVSPAFVVRARAAKCPSATSWVWKNRKEARSRAAPPGRARPRGRSGRTRECRGWTTARPAAVPRKPCGG